MCHLRYNYNYVELSKCDAVIATRKVGKMFSPLRNRVMPAQSAGGKIPKPMMGREKNQDKSQWGIQNKARARGHNCNILQSPNKWFFSKDELPVFSSDGNTTAQTRLINSS